MVSFLPVPFGIPRRPFKLTRGGGSSLLFLRRLARRRCQIFCDLRRLVSVDVSMNTTLPQRKVLPATRNGLRSAGDAMNPSKVGGKLGRCEQIKDLAAMRRYEGWQRDCTMMLDFL
jgi:hypothetical protein